MKAVLSALAALVAAVAPARTETDLGGNGWTCDGLPVKVPHTWNAIDGSDGFPDGRISVRGGSSVMSDSYLRKRGVYRRALPDPTPGKRQFLRFLGACAKTEVFVNGRLVGEHRSAFTAFTFEATAAMKPSGNVLEVAVDNRYDLSMNPLDADFTMCGGLYRTVRLIETDQVCIDPTWHGTDGIVTEADPASGRVSAKVYVSDGTVETRTFDFPSPRLWSPDEPNLYEIEVTVERDGSRDSVRRAVGFRTMEFRDGLFYLNGRRLQVRGVNRHEDYEGKGWALEPGDDELDVRWMKLMGANAVRLAHGAHSWAMCDETDRLGVMALVAIPFVNELQDTEEYRRNAARELEDTIAQFRGHPSVMGWDLYNEIYNSRRGYKEGFQERILEEMRDLAKAADPGHTLFATTSYPFKRRLNAIPDMLLYNIYPGWYSEKDIGFYIDEVAAANGRRTVALGEYGAGGSVYHHENPPRRCRPDGPFHGEEWQLALHMADWRGIASRDSVWGSFIWNMFDFAADVRDEGDRKGINDKGLVTRDRAVAKDAFWFYKANWNPEPMLHLAGKRMRSTRSAAVDVVAFSNMGGKVELFVNGTSRGEQAPDEVMSVKWSGVELAMGENAIEVRSAGRADRAAWVRE